MSLCAVLLFGMFPEALEEGLSINTTGEKGSGDQGYVKTWVEDILIQKERNGFASIVRLITDGR